ALECIEAHDGAAGPAALDPDHAAGEIEDDESGQHAEDGDAADPAQRAVAETAPVAPGRLFQHAGALVGNSDPALDAVQLLQQLLLFHRARGGVPRARLLRLSGRG